MKLRCTCAVVAIVALFAGLTGCATGAKPDAMVVEKVAIAHQSSSSVTVAVSGGKATSGMGASQISDTDFAQALSDSIAKSGLFAQVLPSGGRYALKAFIGKVDQPMIGFSLTVKMEDAIAAGLLLDAM